MDECHPVVKSICSSSANGTIENQKPIDRRRLRKRKSNSARNRLLSIRHDVQHLYGNRHPLQQLQQEQQQSDSSSSSDIVVVEPIVIANERCGLWYVPYPNATCYFKSTDGHTGVWNMSLKRLNWNVLQLVATHGTVIIVDASSKILPDSLSRTIPIWCAVLNRIVQKYRRVQQQSQQLNDTQEDWWDESLYTPEDCVSREEHACMEQILDDRVETLYESHAIVDIPKFLEIFRKPLRPHWITASVFQNLFRQNSSVEQQLVQDDDKYFHILCINASHRSSNASEETTDTFLYTPGAGDDEESWSKGLTPRMFWDHVHDILDATTNSCSTEQMIDEIVKKHHDSNNQHFTGDDDDHNRETQYDSHFDTLGDTTISIGSRRAGRPPECWDHFDAILNVSEQEYENMMMTCNETNHKFYLQLPVKEGKRDKSELERWMAVGVIFVGVHAQQGRRVLIHCAQGLDRSVAVAVAVATLFCQLQFPLKFQERFWDLPFERLQSVEQSNDEWNTKVFDPNTFYKFSGLSKELVENFLGRQGRDKLLQWLHDHHSNVQSANRSSGDKNNDLGHPYNNFSKRTIRIALLLIQQDREKASPTRSTMQKIHRFFLSP